jgi:hypothetical protein
LFALFWLRVPCPLLPLPLSMVPERLYFGFLVDGR